MMIVSNTSPLANLAAIGQFNLLQALYRAIRIAESVWQELHAGGQAWPGSTEVDAARWITRLTEQNGALVTALRQDLDAGEAESIALAVELKADLLLLDEKEGRHHAGRLNVRGHDFPASCCSPQLLESPMTNSTYRSHPVSTNIHERGNLPATWNTLRPPKTVCCFVSNRRKVSQKVQFAYER